MHRAVIAGVFAVGALGLDIAAFLEIALDHQLGVGRDGEVVAHALDQRQGLAPERADQREFVRHRDADAGGHVVQRVGADGEVDRQPLAARDAAPVDAAQIRRSRDVGSGLAPVAQAEAAAAHVGHAAVRVDGEIDRRRDIRPAVELVLRMEGQLGQVRVIARQDDVLDRRRLGRDVFDRLRIGHATRELARQLRGLDTERVGQARARSVDVGDELDLLRPGLPEQHRLGRGLDDGREIGERDRFVVNFQLADSLQVLDEAA